MITFSSPSLVWWQCHMQRPKAVINWYVFLLILDVDLWGAHMPIVGKHIHQSVHPSQYTNCFNTLLHLHMLISVDLKSILASFMCVVFLHARQLFSSIFNFQGGRMSTSRSSSDDKCTVDLGAQYITLIEQYQARRQE